MLRTIILLEVLFISFITSDNGTVPIINNSSNTVEHTAVSKNYVAVVTEKGLLPTDGPDLILPAENPILMTLDRELKINKEKPVKPRKGVEFRNSSEEVTNVDSSVNKTLKVTNSTSETLQKHIVKSVIKNETSVKPVTVTKHIKKPTLLSYEKIEASVNMNNGMQLPETKSSSGPVSDQIPSPNKTFETLGSKSPDMIMPIVITILVVPAFVVLAYMALKRGKEAWKNRHYKRMDFLLDGMYND